LELLTMTEQSALYFSTTASLTALKITVSATTHMLELLIKSGIIPRDAALSQLATVERDARSACDDAEIRSILSSHFRSARQTLTAAAPDH
jgi:hypothetical protein